MGRLFQNIELDLRDSRFQRRDCQELREYKGRYAGILVRRFDRYLSRSEKKELFTSLTGILRYIREVAAAQEPGHPENAVTLDLFRSLRARMQKGWCLDIVGGFESECDEMDAWINMGGCANIKPRSGVKLVSIP
ncbi:hypothetical protein FRC01_013071 [Tulasnella sp. 417]|nr:hypothetical protein FRC01_013071 [Tulasnella sp. 417]